MAVIHGWEKAVAAAGLLFAGHRWGFVSLIRSLGLPFPAFFAVCAMRAEFLCSLSVVLGFYTRACAAAIVTTMLVALYTDWKTGTPAEDAILYAIPLAALILIGPGEFSIDYLVARRRGIGVSGPTGRGEQLKHAGISALLIALFMSSSILARAATASGTTRFVLDGNRVYAELAFARQDGTLHRALAFVDMGGPSMVITRALFEELKLGGRNELGFRVGELSLSVPARQVSADDSGAYGVGDDLKVEAVLPAGVMQKYQVVIDYKDRKLTLGKPGTIKAEGSPTPFRTNAQTGLIAVDAQINDGVYPVTIDNGSAYTWLRQATVKRWLVQHSDWERGVGAVGASNMMMSAGNAEAEGILIRIPEIAIGPVKLNQVGALAAGESKIAGNQELFDWYSTKNPVPVIGWIGGNVLKAFRLTVDYPNHVLYWLRQSAPEFDDLNQVGLTLKLQNGEYVIAAVATKHGRPAVNDVAPGDKLLLIGGLKAKDATWGQIYNAMHGKPGQERVLLLQRGARQFIVRATVTAF